VGNVTGAAAERLATVLSEAASEFGAEEGNRFDYVSLRVSPLLGELKAALEGMASEEAGPPTERSAAISAWLNFHNAALISSIVDRGVTRTVRDARGFEQARSWRLGGLDYSLSDIRHGILGGNRRPPYRLRRPFSSRDPRVSSVVTPSDARLRLALCDGTRSGPALFVYSPDGIDEQLEQAATVFVNHLGGVAGCPGASWIALSPLFAWHSRDFGGPRGVRAFLADRVENEAVAQALRSGSHKIRLMEYDWGLNKCVISK
jgi:hypothetical protein